MTDWRSSVLVDPATGEGVTGRWPSLRTPSGRQFEIDGAGILRWKVSRSDAYDFHQEHSKGAFLRRLEQQKFHQINWESPYYRKVFDGFLEGIDRAGVVALDFGCGDGRFTEYLLSKGFEAVVCVDFDYRLLASLAAFAKERGIEHKLLLVHSDIDDLPLRAGAFRVALAIGVLYYLNERYEAAIRLLGSLLEEQGTLVTGDPDMEGFVLRALLFDSLENALRTFETRRFKESQGPSDLWFRLFTEAESRDIFANAGLDVLDRHGITMFHNLLRVMHVRGTVSEEVLRAHEARIAALFDFLHERGRLHKHTLWKLRKQAR